MPLADSDELVGDCRTFRQSPNGNAIMQGLGESQMEQLVKDGCVRGRESGKSFNHNLSDMLGKEKRGKTYFKECLKRMLWSIPYLDPGVVNVAHRWDMVSPEMDGSLS